MPTRGTAAKKLGRKTDQRAALVRSVARAVVLDGSIETTRSKAQVVRPFVEKLATKARKGGLHNRRQVIAALNDVEATDVLFDRVASTDRTSGYLRVQNTRLRSGDRAQLAQIEFVDELKEAPAETEKPKQDSKKPETKKADTKKSESASKEKK